MFGLLKETSDGEYVRSGRGKRSDIIRRVDESAPSMWPLRSPDAALEDQVHLMEPCNVGILCGRRRQAVASAGTASIFLE
ncbi:MAG: hypothetical protein DLM68_17140 [Hyphomicrobiales bacterium]|nr:MAG: hypothetical protein DLM68_17140 [Hyphomicrobiales bacterium]